ncbi:GIY-YIG catalytic domain protein [compost metagenome]
MHHLYILHSKSSKKYYIGESHNTEERIIKHNQHTYSGSFTKIASDWEFALVFDCAYKEDAVFLEKFIKRMKSKVFIEKIIKDPSILEDILSKK